jgi:hypothetical protein
LLSREQSVESSSTLNTPVPLGDVATCGDGDVVSVVSKDKNRVCTLRQYSGCCVHQILSTVQHKK